LKQVSTLHQISSPPRKRYRPLAFSPCRWTTKPVSHHILAQIICSSCASKLAI
jgi:hypothetical protein